MTRFSSPGFILLVTSATFLCFGIFNAGVGPVLGELAARTDTPIAAVGAIFTALFSGSLLAQIVSGSLTDRFGRKPLFIVSILIFATGIFGICNAQTMPSLLAWGFLAGLGQGGIDLGANLIVADAYHQNNVAALNILHLAFGFGASVGPALISLSLVLVDQGIPVLLGSAVFFLLMAAISSVIRVTPNTALTSSPANAPQKIQRGNVYVSPLLWLLGGLLLLVVGTQFGIGSWSSIYITKTTSFNLEAASMVTSGYWASITVGRIAVAAVSKWSTPFKLLLFNLAGSFVGSLALAISHQWAIPTVIALLFTGFCFGGLYPGVISIAAQAFPSGAGKAVSVIIALGTIGGLVIPLLAGVILENISTTAYIWLIVAQLGGMLVLRALIVKRQNPTETLKVRTADLPLL